LSTPCIEGGLEQAKVDFIIRDFKTEKLAGYQQFLIDLAEKTIKQFPGATFSYQEKEQYRNMREILQDHLHIEANAKLAMQRLGMEHKAKLVRGGTDGSRLSFMGLPCPNLFTGEMAIHSKQEYVSVQDMEKAIQTIVEIVKIYEEQAK
jgi:tripeptide aminopeptidase